MILNVLIAVQKLSQSKIHPSLFLLFDQVFHHGPVVSNTSQMQWGTKIPVCTVDLRTSFDQKLDYVNVSVRRGDVEKRIVVLPAKIQHIVAVIVDSIIEDVLLRLITFFGLKSWEQMARNI